MKPAIIPSSAGRPAVYMTKEEIKQIEIVAYTVLVCLMFWNITKIRHQHEQIKHLFWKITHKRSWLIIYIFGHVLKIYWGSIFPFFFKITIDTSCILKFMDML